MKKTKTLIAPYLLFFFVLASCAGDPASNATSPSLTIETPISTPDSSPPTLSDATPTTQTSTETLQIVPLESNENGNDSQYPIFSDAQNIAVFGSFTTYQSNIQLSAATDYYKSELVSDDWVFEREIVEGNTVILLFTLGARNLSVALNSDPDQPGTLSIVIAEGQ